MAEPLGQHNVTEWEALGSVAQNFGQSFTGVPAIEAGAGSDPGGRPKPKRQPRKNKPALKGIRAMCDIHRQRTSDFAAGEQAFKGLGADPNRTWGSLHEACESLEKVPGLRGYTLCLGGRNPSTGCSGSKQYVKCVKHKMGKCPWFILFELSVEDLWVLHSFCKDVAHHNHPPQNADPNAAKPFHLSAQSLTKSAPGEGGEIMVSLSAVGEACSKQGIADETLHGILVGMVEQHGYTAKFSKDDVSGAYRVDGAPPPAASMPEVRGAWAHRPTLGGSVNG